MKISGFLSVQNIITGSFIYLLQVVAVVVVQWDLKMYLSSSRLWRMQWCTGTCRTCRCIYLLQVVADVVVHWTCRTWILYICFSRLWRMQWCTGTCRTWIPPPSGSDSDSSGICCRWTNCSRSLVQFAYIYIYHKNSIHSVYNTYMYYHSFRTLIAILKGTINRVRRN